MWRSLATFEDRCPVFNLLDELERDIIGSFLLTPSKLVNLIFVAQPIRLLTHIYILNYDFIVSLYVISMYILLPPLSISFVYIRNFNYSMEYAFNALKFKLKNLLFSKVPLNPVFLTIYKG